MLAPAGTPLADITPSEETGGRVLITFAVLHVASFSLLWGPVPWVYLGESFPLRVRAKCIALGAATNWVRLPIPLEHTISLILLIPSSGTSSSDSSLPRLPLTSVP